MEPICCQPTRLNSAAEWSLERLSQLFTNIVPVRAGLNTLVHMHCRQLKIYLLSSWNTWSDLNSKSTKSGIYQEYKKSKKMLNSYKKVRATGKAEGWWKYFHVRGSNAIYFTLKMKLHRKKFVCRLYNQTSQKAASTQLWTTLSFEIIRSFLQQIESMQTPLQNKSWRL